MTRYSLTSHPLHPEYTNIFLYDLTGHLLCSGIPTNPTRVAAITSREWYQNVRRTLADQPPLSISVNLSSRHFRNPHLVERVEEIVATSGLMPACLHLEITERVMLEPTDLAVHLLAESPRIGGAGPGR